MTEVGASWRRETAELRACWRLSLGEGHCSVLLPAGGPRRQRAMVLRSLGNVNVGGEGLGHVGAVGEGLGHIGVITVLSDHPSHQ